ncbi:hypothetical protein QVD17_38854 [Tagetes erecta]|uniref:Uncharacterized protein n=1 Tax=Tagetes erecta TaxID=13708 RepID=A0AAD8JMI1_TARER|nr:hypothetical protein QVD17_38854 [Tagetes erecta]
MQLSSMNSVSPSFTGNSSNNLADIAARVVAEFRSENGHDDDNDIYDNAYVDDDEPNRIRTENLNQINENKGEEEEEDEFEFDVVCRSNNLTSVSADEIFSNGEIVPKYPLFDQSLLLNETVDDNSDTNLKPVAPSVRHSLGKLFEQERESVLSKPIHALSKGDTPSKVSVLDGVSPDMYCIWKPKVESPERCKKSKSTGNSSKRWRFRNILQRSNSDGHIAVGKNASDLSQLTLKKKKVDKTAKVAGADVDDGEFNEEVDFVSKMNKGGGGSGISGKLKGGSESLEK